MNLFKRKPKEDTVTLAMHRSAVDNLQAHITELLANNRALYQAAAHFRSQRDEARADAAANAADALAHRTRLKRDREYHANRRQSRDKQQAEVGA